MSKAVIAIVAVAGLGVGIGGAAAYSGRAVTTRLEEQARSVVKNFPIAKIVREEKTNGLLSSTYDVTMRFGCLPNDPSQAGGPAEPIELTFHNVIQHAPLPNGKLGIAAIDSEIRLPEKWQKVVKEVIGDKPVFTAHSTVNFQGELESDIAFPGIKASSKKGGFELKPIVGKVTGKASGKTRSYAMEIPSIDAVANVDQESVTFKISKIRSSGELGENPNDLWLTPGKTEGSIDSVVLDGAIPAMDTTPRKPFHVELTAFKFDTKNVLDNGLFSSASDLSFKGKVNDFAIDKIETKGSFKRLHAATYQHLMQELMLGSLTCDPQKRASPLAQIDTLMKDGLELLKHNPQYGLDKLGVVLDGKDAELSYSVGTEGVSSADMMLGAPIMLMTKGVVHASLKVHTGLIERAVNEAGKLAQDPKIAAQAGNLMPGGAAPNMVMVNAMIDQAASEGFVVRQGDYVSASADFKAGQLTVNGKPFQIPLGGPGLTIPGGP